MNHCCRPPAKGHWKLCMHPSHSCLENDVIRPCQRSAMACEWPQQLSFQILRIRTPQHFLLRQSKMFNPFQARCFFSLTIFFFVFGPVYVFFFPASTVVFMVLKLFFWRSWKLLLSPKRSDADLSRPSDVQSCKVEGQSCVSCLKSSCFRVSIGKEIWDFDISFWYVTIQFITSYHFRTLLSSWWTVCLKFSSCEAEDAPRLPLQEIRQARTNRYE